MNVSAPPCPPDVDSGLVAAAQTGEVGAFRQLVERHHRRIYRFLLKHAITAAEAEELTQEVFLQAYLGLTNFRNESRCLTWLTGIALNLVRNYTNRSPWRLIEIGFDNLPPGFEADALDEGSLSCNPEHQTARRAALDALIVGLGKLSADARESLMLVCIEGLPYEEAAILLGEPTGSIKSRVSRARQQLLQYIDPCHLEALAK